MRRLAIYTHKLFRRTPNGLETTGGFTIQMDALAPYFEEVILCLPIVDEAGFNGVRTTAPNISFHPLPYRQGRMGFLRSMRSLRCEMLAVMAQSDLALVILPSYVGSMASILCQRRRFPVFQWVVGDWGRDVQVRRRNWITRWCASVIGAPLLDWLMARLTRDVLTFYNGRILHDQGKPNHFTRVSSSIRQDNFYTHDKALTLTPPYRLLFVGRLSPEKGVVHLLAATRLLTIKGHPVELHIVGTGPLEAALQQQAVASSTADRVFFHGFVPQGEALRRHYRESDLFILPSLQDQQPKVLMEAMSQGVPVIAANVGGIPSVVRDSENGILVPPAQPEAITEAVERVLNNDELRERLIAGGLTYAREHTVERETARMLKILEVCFDQKRLWSDTGA